MNVISDKITSWGTHEDKTIAQIQRCAIDERVARAALCADGHLGYAVPIGGVVGYRNAISPSGVGFDIACGNKAVRLDMPGEELRSNIARIMDDVWSTISFGIGRKNNERVDHPLFESETWSLACAKPLKQKAEAQLGTVGSGNHYVDLFSDEQDRVWIGVHFGSRGLGHGIATWFLKAAGAKDGMEVDPCVLDISSDLGQQYIAGMELGGAYAYAGRDWVCSRVAQILGAPVVEEVHNHHNYAWKETHGGEELWVVRKGATPAFPGQRGFVGGTMAEQAVILEGVASSETSYSLCSTVHGAGRVMGRMEAAGSCDRKTGVCKRPGKITPEMMSDSVKAAKVELRGAGVDESPHCYKRLPEVLAAHGDSIRILHRLTPVGVAMASAKEFDPYKD